jgi:hypothetical protein
MAKHEKQAKLSCVGMNDGCNAGKFINIDKASGTPAIKISLRQKWEIIRLENTGRIECLFGSSHNNMDK